MRTSVTAEAKSASRAVMVNAGRTYLAGLAPQPREFRAAALSAEVVAAWFFLENI
jgi:hypothetical protein